MSVHTNNNKRKTIETICKTFFKTADNIVHTKQNTHHDRMLDLHNEIPEIDVHKTVINTKKQLRYYGPQHMSIKKTF